jgi:N-acetylmuramoyl-L-alanine amidase
MLRAVRPTRFLRVLAALAALAALGGPALARGAVPVDSLTLSGAGDSARLVIALGAPTRAAVFTLETPDRVVIDLSAARFDSHRLKVPAPAGPVREVRVAPRDSGNLRVVLDLDRRVSPHYTPDPSGRRVVVELGGLPDAAPPPPPPVARSLPSTNRDLVIAVDAGHGGDDPGATGRGGTREKDVTLAVARSLAAKINAEPGMRAVLTRDGDYFVELKDRVARAHRANADLFVSIHADAIADRSIAGASVYVLSQRGASSETAKLLADRENAAALIGAPLPADDDVRSIVIDLAKNQAISDSMEAASKVLEQLDEVGEVRKAKVQQAGFVVLKAAAMPSMLIESAYITNPGEEKRLRDPHHQLRLADAILAGIRNYFRENPPPGTRMAAMVAANAAPATATLGAPPHALER